jgi:iron(III) transport system substrate-binding protein
MRRLLLLAFVILVALSVGSGALAKSTVTLYTSVPQQIVDEIRVAFEAANPGIKVDIYRSGTSNVLAKLNAEVETGRIVADVLWVADAAVYETLKDRKLLHKYTPVESKAIPAEYQDPDGYYYHARLTNVVIGYNTARLRGANVPTSWNDLTDPKFKGKIGMSTPERSGAFLVAASALVNNPGFGWGFFEKAHANGAVYDSNNGVLQKVATGELLLGVVLDFQVREMKDQGSPVDFVWPKEGAVLAPSPVAIVAKGPNLEGAKTFVEYVLSKAGQTKLSSLGMIPARSDVSAPKGAPALDEIPLMKVDWAWTAANQALLVQKFNALTQ